MTGGFGLISCHGKEAYATQGRAMEVLRRRRGRAHYRVESGRDRRELASLSAYHCKFCHHWHIGGEHRLKGARP